MCLVNFIPPANGASLGSFKSYFGPRPQPYRTLFGQIKNFETCFFVIDVGVCGFFISVKFATSLLALLAGGKNNASY